MVYRRGHHRRGGARKGAGRKPKDGKAGVSHARRQRLGKRSVVHVTMRVVKEMAGLRRWKQYQQIRRALHLANQRADFRVVQFSIQGNHFHLLIEVDSKPALSRGMQGLNISVAKRLNKLAGRRKGKVFKDRYHARVVKNPRQARNALCYVLHNARRHGVHESHNPHWLDPCSSQEYFDGWSHRQRRTPPEPSPDEQVVRPARSWLLTEGWKRYGLLHSHESPGSKRA